MAGDWIKMRHDLAEDPAVIAIAAATGLDEFGVVGRLHRVWCWADRQTRDGNARGVTQMWLDRALACDGFAAAMVCVGWLEVDGASIRIPGFDAHISESAKQRGLAARRAARKRSKTSAKSNASSVTFCDAREEKRREEYISPPTPSFLPDCLASVESLTLPPGFDTPAVRQALAGWLAYLPSRGKPVDDPGQVAQAVVQMFAGSTPAHLVAEIARAIAGGWKNIHADGERAAAKSESLGPEYRRAKPPVRRRPSTP